VLIALKVAGVELAFGVGTRAHVDDPTLLALLQLLEQEIGEEERRQVVDLEHRLVAVFGFGARGHEDTGVVDQHIKGRVPAAERLRQLTDLPERREVRHDVVPASIARRYLDLPDCASALFAFRAARTTVKAFLASSSAVTLPTPSVAPVIRQIRLFISRPLVCALRTHLGETKHWRASCLHSQ
jgi:hypothetical protein